MGHFWISWCCSTFHALPTIPLNNFTSKPFPFLALQKRFAFCFKLFRYQVVLLTVLHHSPLLFGGCLSKAQPYRNKTGFALCFVLSGAMPSHRTIPDLFQPPGSRNSPTAPALACSCNGVSLASPPTYRMMLRLLAENKKAGYCCSRWKPLNRGKSMSNRPSMSLSTATG